jgi:hypothetical protein
MTHSSAHLATGLRVVLAVLLVSPALAVPHPTGQVPARWPEATAVAGPTREADAGRRDDAARGAGAERQQAALVEEDQRLLTLVESVRTGSGPYVQTVGTVDTLVLTPRGSAYSLADLLALNAAAVQPDGDVLLTQNVFVAPQAQLAIDAPGARVRLRSNPSGFVSLVAWKAHLTLAGAEGTPLGVSSWDPGRNGADVDVVDGRAYIRDVSGDMQVQNVNVSDLGFWAGRTSGVAWTGSARTASTGSIVGSTFRANHYGAFASRGQGLSITRSSFTANTVDGVSLHRSTVATTIGASSAQSNGRHGFSADQGSEDMTFTDVTAADNAAYGIFFSGTPLSAGRSAGGASLRAYGKVEIVGGWLRSNQQAGLRVVDGQDVAVSSTTASGNHDGIVLAGTIAPTTVQNTVVTGSHRLGISVSGGWAEVSGNRVTGAQTAIHVRDASVAVTANVVARATNHAVSVIGAARGSSLVGNTISGRGPSGLDTYRLDPKVSVELSGNDIEGWTRDRDNWKYFSTFIPTHKMLLLWVVLLGLPMAFALTGRRRRVPVGTAPYADDFRREHAAPLTVDVGRRISFREPA